MAPKMTKAQQAFLSLQKAADGLMGEVAELFKPYGISPTQSTSPTIQSRTQSPGWKSGAFSFARE